MRSVLICSCVVNAIEILESTELFQAMNIMSSF